MRTIKLTIAYDGTNYHGWQIQPHDRTIQGEIESHLAAIHTSHIPLHGAGRTDAGVHALAMVAHFQTDTSLAPAVFQKALNTMLDEDIRILAAEEVPADFHARFSAQGKTYSYSFFNGQVLPPLQRHYTYHIKRSLNLSLLQECLTALTGTHDFSSFEAAGSRDPENIEGRGAVRTIHRAALIDSGNDFYVIEITGDGFLRHMVRNIVGTVVEVSLGKRSFERFLAGFAANSRSQTGATAPARGLTLKRIYYSQDDLNRSLEASSLSCR